MFAVICTACSSTLMLDISAVDTVYCVGYDFDLSGLIINLKEGNKRTQLSLEQVTVSPLDTSTVGEKTVTITYGKLSQSFTVEVVEGNIVTYIDGDFFTKEIVKIGECAEGIERESTENSFFSGWYNSDTPYDFTQTVTSQLTLIAHRIGVDEYRQVVKAEFNTLYQQWTDPDSAFSYTETDLLSLQSTYQDAYDALDSLDTVTQLMGAISDLESALFAIPTESIRVDEYLLEVKEEFATIFAQWKSNIQNYYEKDYQALFAVYQQAYDALDQCETMAQLQQALVDLPNLLAAVPIKEERIIIDRQDAKEQFIAIFEQWISIDSVNKYLEEDFAHLQIVFQNAYDGLEALNKISAFEQAIQGLSDLLATVPTAIERVDEYEAANFDYDALTEQEATYVRGLFDNAREEILLTDGGAPNPDYIFYLLKTYTHAYKK